MKVIYAKEAFPVSSTKALFLAGPTPRSREVASWRPQALAILEAKGYDGVVFVPEPRSGDFDADYIVQVEWEEEGLRLADCILFWVPRNLEHLPGFTTNVEFGWWMHSGKVVLGAPKEAPSTRYLRYHATKLLIPQAETLAVTIDAALTMIDQRVAQRSSSLHQLS